MALQHLRSGTANKRPLPTAMSDGQLAVNTNLASPGLFFKDSNGDLVKAGPVHVGTTAPNASPASTAATALVANTIYKILTVGTSDFTAVGASANTVGTVFTASGTTTGTGTVSGEQGNEKGEQWLDTTNSLYVMKVYDGTGWRVTDSISLANGSAAAPSLHFGSDTNTGLFRSAADSLAVTTGGTQRVVVDSSGNVGIGTANPAKKLEVRVAENGSDGIRINELSDTYHDLLASGGDLFIHADSKGDNGSNNVLRFGVGSTGEKMRIDSSGRLGVGTSSPGQLVQIGEGDTGVGPNVHSITRIEGRAVAGGEQVATLEFNQVTNAPAEFVGASVGIESSAGTRSESELVFKVSQAANTNATEAMRLSHDGRLGIGTTTPQTITHLFGENPVLRIQDSSTAIADAFAGIQFAESGSGESLGNYWQIALEGDSGTSSDHLTFKDGTGERMRIDSSGNVGIGTTSPGANLELGTVGGSDQTIRINSDGNGYLELVAGGSLNKLISGNAATGNTNLSFETASGGTENEAMRIDSSGNVGIGTTSPAEPLHIADTVPVIRFEDTNNSNALLDISGSGGDCRIDIDPTGLYGSSRFSVDIDGSERLRIDSSGRLLVGTSSARDKYDSDITPRFQVEGTSKEDSSIAITRWNGGLTASPVLFFGGTNSTTPGIYTLMNSGEYLGEISFEGTDGSKFVPGAKIEAAVDGTPGADDMPGRLVFSTTADGASSPTERLRIDSSGNVGIGTSSPDSILDIQSDTPLLYLEDTASYGSAGSQIIFRGLDSGGTSRNFAKVTGVGSGSNSGKLVFQTRDSGSLADRVTIDSSGNVGIGTTSPSNKLDVFCALGDGIRVGGGAVAGTITRESEGLRITGASTTQNISFLTAGSEAMRVDTSGRLLVGTSTSNDIFQESQLQIEGNTSAKASLSLHQNQSAVDGPQLILGKSRGSGSVGSSDILGDIVFAGNDGTDVNSRGAIIRAKIDGTPGSNDLPTHLAFMTTADGASSPTERMRISSDGSSSFRSGTTQQAKFGTLDGSSFQNSENYVIVYGNAAGNQVLIRGCNTADGTPAIDVNVGGTRRIEIESDGDVFNVNGTYGQISDIKLKENVIDASSQWDDIKALRVRNFNFKAELGYNSSTQIGFVAQEVEEVSPGLVKTNPDKDMEGNDLGTETKALKMSVMHVKAVKALQEAMERIETLEQRLSDAGIA